MLKAQVELITNTTSVLKNLIFAAKICYGKEHDHLSEVDQIQLITKILKARHFSILEHCSLMFYITGVSRNFSHQLVRHRHISYAQQSLHYTIAEDTSIAIGTKVPTEYIAVMELQAKRAVELYQTLVDKGVPREEARHILPSGIATKIVCTSNLREWLHFVSIRSCKVNCEEIREVALQIEAILLAQFPWLLNYLGPSCIVNKRCYEGAKGCLKSI